jgi:hypothetical protein
MTGDSVRREPIADTLDLLRYDEIRRQADLGRNLWESLLLAAERGDDATTKLNARQIAALTKATIALVNRLGQAEPDQTPMERDAKAWRDERERGYG